MPDTTTSNRINAHPTKELFIYMLTRDIPLIRAILDLIDNAVDGVTRIQESDDYSNFWIKINCTKESFKISDNCGGIPIEIAREYAFRFGRPKATKTTPGSIGKFGVGMKRAFFKLGNIFEVKSTTVNSSFVVKHDIRNWLEDPNTWEFEFVDKKEDFNIAPNDDTIGTQIVIRDLFDSVANSFSLSNFEIQLQNQIELAHSVMTRKGLSIFLNNRPIGKKNLSLLKSDKLIPAHFEKTYDNIGSSPVRVNIYAGISERNIEDGGWYIFCNGRMVLEADQSSVTTWGQDNNMQKYHPIFAYFRGYVFFDSDDAELLPWTTTKTGVDLDSQLYKMVKLEMINIITPIISFLRKLDSEREQLSRGEIDISPLEQLRKSAYTTYSAQLNSPLFAQLKSPQSALIKVPDKITGDLS